MNTSGLPDNERNEYDISNDLLLPETLMVGDGDNDFFDHFTFNVGEYIAAPADINGDIELPHPVEGPEAPPATSTIKPIQHEDAEAEPDLSLTGAPGGFDNIPIWRNEWDSNVSQLPVMWDQLDLSEAQDERSLANTGDDHYLRGIPKSVTQRSLLEPPNNGVDRTFLSGQEELSAEPDQPPQESTVFFSGRPSISRSITSGNESPGKRKECLQQSSSRSSWSFVDRSATSSHLSVQSFSSGAQKEDSHESSVHINWPEENLSAQVEAALISTRGRKRPYEPEKRAKVQSVRDASACIRCQVMKEECSEDTAEGPCSRCQLLSPSYRIWKTPCFRGQLSSAEVFRSVSCSLYWPLGSPRKVTTWDGKDQRTIDLFFPKSPANHLAVPKWPIGCRKFRPDPRDLMTKSYPTPHGTVIVQFTPFVLNRMPPAKRVLEEYVEPNMEYFMAELTVGTVGELFRRTIEEAKRLSGQSRMLTDALQIAVLTRLSSRSFGISDRETLGMEIQQDPLSPYHGRRPVPPMIDRQLDLTWLTLAEKKRKSVLAELKKLIFKRDRAAWLEVFLTIFILMSNLEFCYQHQWNRLKRHEATSTKPLMSFATLSMLEKWESSADNMIAHFAVICNGQVPFHLDWSSGESSLLAGLDDRSSDYMKDLVGLIKTIQWPNFTQYPPELARLQELYWISKIFFPPAHLWSTCNQNKHTEH